MAEQMDQQNFEEAFAQAARSEDKGRHAPPPPETARPAPDAPATAALEGQPESAAASGQEQAESTDAPAPGGAEGKAAQGDPAAEDKPGKDGAQAGERGYQNLFRKEQQRFKSLEGRRPRSRAGPPPPPARARPRPRARRRAGPACSSPCAPWCARRPRP